MRKLVSIVAIYFAFVSFSVSAHDGVVHVPVDATGATKSAHTVISEIIKMKQIDASWAGIEPVSVETRENNEKTEWVVIINNNKAENAAEQTIYIFLTLGGDYLAANFTGK